MVDELPLFPLNTVLFPGAALALHIFEARYREMVARCLETRSPFGVALIRRGREVGEHAEPHAIGTTALITRSNRLDDGRYEILAEGKQRFRILSRDQTTHSYQVGRVEILPEQEGDVSGQVIGELSAAFEEFNRLARALSDQWERRNVAGYEPVSLAYHIAARLPLDAAHRQEILAAADAGRRLALLRSHLADQLPSLRDQVASHYQKKLQGFGSGN
jgi:Lon protease-like protein